MRRTTTTFDDAGRLIEKRDAKGAIVTYSYDLVDRLTLRHRSDGVRISHTYDALGRRTSMEDPHGLTEYKYDEVNRLKAVGHPGGQRLTYSYEERGLRSQLNAGTLGVFTYSHDAVGRLRYLKNPQNQRTTFYYDATRRSGIKHSNNTRVSYLYDELGRVKNVNHRKADGSLISSLTTTYDAVGNRTLQAELSGAQVAWTYDDTHQLKRETRTGAVSYDVTHVYDAVGNRLQQIDSGDVTQFTYDAANQVATMVAPGGVRSTFTYDAAGNQLRVVASDGARYTFVWDAENRLKNYTDASIGALTSYSYDGDGRRLTYNRGGTVSRSFLWDLENVLCETNLLNSAQTLYTLEPLLYGNLLASGTPSATSKWYHFDPLGSTDRTTNSAGTATNQSVYRAFGDVASTGATGAYLWNGQSGYYSDVPSTAIQALANLYVRARYLDLTTARWASEDPIPARLGGDVNPYRYVENLPTHLTDPSGMQFISCTPWVKTVVPCTAVDQAVCDAACKAAGKGGGKYTVCYNLTRTCTYCWGLFSIGEFHHGGDCLCAPKPPGNKKQPGCPNPCPPPTVQIDLVPPAKPHFPCAGNHWHYIRYNQTPPPACACIPQRIFGGCL